MEIRAALAGNRTVERRQCLMRLREQINMSETGRELR